MDDVCTREVLKQLSGHVVSGSSTRRGVVELAGIRFGVSHEIGKRARSHLLRMHNHHMRNLRDHSDRLKVLFEVIGELGVYPTSDNVVGRSNKEGVAVRGSFRRLCGSQIATRSCTIIN
jgi:hypothetical protein